ncbi:GNAT family N-acetyltransferase [Sporosarcina sp. E16_8]|uniref:GNAT family N-acetyltransferase n=1 Tax=Sporosarcina sp. E16_8 TaxID=2789295 RepID=UPI001A90F5E6|nr:GNAT family N-acetyltransferase [Sporosarcina sp. E16_8]MBO0588553.1 GNAT family N-acetyltransferase [Sporosarcina sp. E16_8]
MLRYKQFLKIPEDEIVDGILQLHESVFKGSNMLVEKIKSKPKVLINVALDQSTVVGYKIGYELNSDKYYSWYGAVHEEYRGKGVASRLLDQQHCYLVKSGYQIVQTKTRNKWRSMLILNIKKGFNVMETFTDDEGIHRIVLEKKLSTNKMSVNRIPND